MDEGSSIASEGLGKDRGTDDAMGRRLDAWAQEDSAADEIVAATSWFGTHAKYGGGFAVQAKGGIHVGDDIRRDVR